MNNTITLTSPLPAVTVFEQAFNQFDEIVTRFLATRKSEHTRETYRRALDQYRATARRLELDPMKKEIKPAQC